MGIMDIVDVMSVMDIVDIMGIFLSDLVLVAGLGVHRISFINLIYNL